jgi:WD40 repeat protein
LTVSRSVVGRALLLLAGALLAGGAALALARRGPGAPVVLRHTSAPTEAVFGPGGAVLISDDGDDLRVWTAAGPRAWESRLIASAAAGRHCPPSPRLCDQVAALALSPDGATLATGGAVPEVRLWDTASGQLLGALEGHSQFILDAAFSPDGATLATASDDGTVRLWDVAARQTRHLLAPAGMMRLLTVAVFSPDGASLATGGLDGVIRLWDAASGQERRQWQAHARAVLSLSYSPDGQTLASGGRDGVLRLWDAPSGAERLARVLNAEPPMDANPVAFSPDGRLVAASDGKPQPSVLLWEAATGARVRELRGHTFVVTGLVFSPDGGTLASVSGDGTIRLWPVE